MEQLLRARNFNYPLSNLRRLGMINCMYQGSQWPEDIE